MIKRWTAVLLSLCLFICVVPASLAADTVVTAQAPESVPAVGETFEVVVSLSGNPGVNAVQFRVDFDPKVVVCEKIQYGKLLWTMLSESNTEAKSGSAVVAAASLDASKGDGELATLMFKVIGEGTPKLSVTMEELTGLVNDAFTNVSHSIDSQGIVGRKDASAPTDPELPVDPEQSVDPEVPTEPTEPAKPEQPKVTFPDVPATHWAAADIARANELGLVKGGSDGRFNPDAPVTRAAFVVMLWRMAGQPETTATADYKDVPADSWYAKQVAWASEKGYVTGNDGMFYPDGQLTREQAMAILFRYSGGVSGMEAALHGIYDEAFADSGKISPWAKNAVYWAVFQTLVKGIESNGVTKIEPALSASRAQISVILLRYMEL